MNIGKIVKFIVVATLFVTTTSFEYIHGSCATSSATSPASCTDDGDCCGSPDNNIYCIPTSSESSSGFCSCQASGCFCSQNSDCSSSLCVLESGQIYGYCSCAPENNCSCTANDQCGSNYCNIKSGKSSGTCDACTSTSCSNSSYSCTAATGTLVCTTVPSGSTTACTNDYCYTSEIVCTTQSDCATGAQCYSPPSGSSYCQACSTSQAGMSAQCTNDGDCCGSPDNNTTCMSNGICSCVDNGCPCDDSVNGSNGQNTSCSSGLCFNNVCSYAPANNGSCMLASQCSSNVCTIPSGSTVGTCQPCSSNSDCSGSSYGNYCVTSICIATQPECTSDSQCSSGYCDMTNYVCVSDTTCSDNSSCSTGVCDATTGTCTACQDSSNLPCLNDGQCCNNVCTTSDGLACGSGDTCTCSCAPQTGCLCSSADQCYSNVCNSPSAGIAQSCQPCQTDGDCSGSSYGNYCANGICIAIEPECTSGSQCASGSCDMTSYTCVNDTACSDGTSCNTGVCDVDTSTCTSCQSGGWTCINDGNCCNNICVTSDGSACSSGDTCQCSYAPAVGGYCTNGDQCYGNVCIDNACAVCSANSDCAGSPYGSYCTTTTGMCSTQESECTENTQCSSGYCQINSSGANECTACQDINAICLNDGDCCSSYCNDSGMCSYIPLGSACSSNEQCGSPAGTYGSGDATYLCNSNTCVLFSCDNGICMESMGFGCTNDDQYACTEGAQITSPCSSTNPCPTYSYCNETTGWCAAQTSECTSNSYCSSGYCQLDTQDNSSYCSACQVNNSQYSCSTDGDCCSGGYCDNEVCVPYEATTLINNYENLYLSSMICYNDAGAEIVNELIYLAFGQSLSIPTGTSQITLTGWINTNGNSVQFTMYYYDCENQNVVIQTGTNSGSVQSGYSGVNTLAFYNSAGQVVFVAAVSTWDTIGFMYDMDIASFTLPNCGFWNDVNLDYNYCVNSSCSHTC